jgi:hypothetical protein
MKRFTVVVTGLALLCLSGRSMAQSPDFSVGILSSHFHNYKSDQRVSDIRNPFGYGAVVGCRLNDALSLGFTGEYFSGGMENRPGDETAYRGSLSFFVFPVQSFRLKPYLSAGLVATHRAVENADGNDTATNRLQIRESVGVDLAILPAVSLNFDVAAYSDGLKFLGVANSFGLRYAL